MRGTEVLADPLAATLARLLTPPCQQLYALLWRAGVLQVEHPQPVRRPAPPDPGPAPRPRPSPHLRCSAPAASRSGRSACSRATG
ncbi:Rv1535 domain-containing protein [Mycolicibacter acidiphilus]|uniref:Rv1535 domain-containing protein n=1 Tax=Mycolicibacter acidiphilus TaxID=2835306 RepID=UPI0027DC2C04|nr:Rv1535 domain-containing protein [Mycolicibacter acidiphilus]